jgi:hypothetical protein
MRHLNRSVDKTTTRGGQITGTQVIELPITNYWNKCNSITNYKLHLIFLPNYKLRNFNYIKLQIT